ncbi:alpha-tocopherol transfer protein-like [Galleria mellonella]|uniref:Alpha-tocopherol transfer protein-like n=1 Tax=Galleria mellonella TaxID=7137 RepID=A0A6J3BVG5_GALME|nr:alpha-tocopherol transfer protein-like [Galleria mellonella]XP_031764377.1 alpha-tocopherol transfer protein-like [Galleria mellonella]
MAFKDAQHPLYPYTEEEKQEIRKELGLKESTIQDDIDAILDWFSKQPHLIDAGISRAIIERLLIISKGSLEKTKQKIDCFYKYRYLAPELIQNRERELCDHQKDIWTFIRQAAMPKLYKGNRVSVFKFMESDPCKFNTDALFRNTFMLGDIRLTYDYMLGDIWLLDIKEIGVGHVLRANPITMQKTAQIFQDGMGLRVAAIHVLNAPILGQTVLNFMKQFFKPKIMDRVMIHNSVEELHKYLPKRYLPKDYGGDLPSLEEFKDNYEKEFRSSKTKQYLLDCSKLVSNESKRPGSDIYDNYMSGSFKKLELD